MKKNKEKNEFKVLIVYPNLSLMLVPSIVIALFTKILKEQGYIVDLFDTTHYISKENSSPQNRVKYLQARKFSDTDDLGIKIKTDLLGDFEQKVQEFKPDILIVSVVEDSFRQALKMLEQVNKYKIPHIVGGVFPTAAPEVLLSFPVIRNVGIGEGEKTIVNFAEAIRVGHSLRNIPNIWGKNNDDSIFKNKLGPLVNINDYDTDFSLFDERRFFRPMGGKIFKTIPIETYRGCPYRCTYCNSPMQIQVAKENNQGKYLRRKKTDEVRDRLLEVQEKYSPEFIYFIDDSFLARPEKEIYEFCDMYEEFNLPFWFNTRPENCTKEILQRLKEVGAYRMSFGIECGNEEFRSAVLKRKVRNQETIRKFEVISQSGISYSVNLIIGFPGETRELVMDTVELTRLIKGYDTLTVSIFTPYHGTKLREVAVKNGWLEKNIITTHTTSESILQMPQPYLSKDEINQLMRVIPLYCYFPRSEWKEINLAEIDDENVNAILGHYSKIYSENFLKENQNDRKVFIEGTGGCRSNPKDSFWLSQARLTKQEISMLSV